MRRKKQQQPHQQIDRTTKRRKNRYVCVKNALNTSHLNSILIVASITFELKVRFFMPMLFRFSLSIIPSAIAITITIAGAVAVTTQLN